jgi:hypothetical protein
MNALIPLGNELSKNSKNEKKEYIFLPQNMWSITHGI